MSDALPAFQEYQQQFTGFIRDPKQSKPPAGVTAKRMRVYAEIVFNNMESSVAACYPVSKKVVGQRAWLKLVRGFFSDYQSGTPIFREIPEQFLHYINTYDDLPAYLPKLAHYEWVELAVSTTAAQVKVAVNTEGDLLQGKLVLNPALEILSYDYPVHLISPRHKPSGPLAESVHLLVYRNAEFQVKFMELNPVTAQLVQLLKTGEYTGQQVLLCLAEALAHPNPQAILQYGAEILADLKVKGVILGTVF